MFEQEKNRTKQVSVLVFDGFRARRNIKYMDTAWDAYAREACWTKLRCYMSHMVQVERSIPYWSAPSESSGANRMAVANLSIQLDETYYNLFAMQTIPPATEILRGGCSGTIS